MKSPSAIDERRPRRHAGGVQLISVDTRKKELTGNDHNAGRRGGLRCNR